MSVRVVCLMGPTAAGKTDLALDIARKFPVELVSVDSGQIYRGMDIGTAKPSADVLREFPHHLVDILDPCERYSAASFRDDACRLIGEISARGKLPVLVGGTMLYFKALQQGLSVLPEADAEVRRQLEAEALEVGWAVLHQRLAEVDPITAARLHPNDSQRVQRALEVFLVSGKPLSVWLDEADVVPSPFEFVNLAVVVEDRAVLHQRIEARFVQMLADGFVLFGFRLGIVWLLGLVWRLFCHLVVLVPRLSFP